MLYIRKYPRKKDAIRINSEKDIPDMLKGTIQVAGDQIKMLSAEGWTVAQLGQVVGFDKKAPTETGYGAWPLREGTYIEKDGEFYPLMDICQAVRVEPPFSMKMKYGTATLKEGEHGLALTTSYGSKCLLTLGTTSADGYMICDKDGNEIAPLSEIDKYEPLKERQLIDVKKEQDDQSTPEY